MRTLLLVLDSVGCGHAPDAGAYGDAGANTLRRILDHCATAGGPDFPALESLGLLDVLRMSEAGLAPPGLAKPGHFAIGVLEEVSAGKDTTTGHWELAGAPLAEPFPVFKTFPEELVRGIEQDAGIRFIANIAASGTEILDRFGPEHLETGAPILYTSADSVLQIAAHEEIVPLDTLYKICETARRHADRYGIGRVIARPFVGGPGAFKRTAGRHDFSLRPPRTILNALHESEIPVTGIGKIGDIFAMSGISESIPTASNDEGMAVIDRLWDGNRGGVLFANLVDFDMVFGHRRDTAGYARALSEFDRWLGRFLPRIHPEDIVLITADHGNDPGWHGTDHTRERTPLWVLGAVPAEHPGFRGSYADVAASLSLRFGLPAWPCGKSFL